MHFLRCSNIFILSMMFLFSWSNLTGQITLIVEELPGKIPSTNDVYVSGDFEGWSGGQESYKLDFKNGYYKISIPKFKETIHFKFTQGSWASVELDKDGKQLDNRSYTFTEQADTLRVKIFGWADLSPMKSTASENVHLLADNFDMSPLNKKRRVWIYLPDSYHNSKKKYPVLYMHDGQNLFDESIAFGGEWEVDETLDAFSRSDKLELIIVGIDNGGSARIDEYTPWEIKDYPSKQQGDAYVQFIVKNLKPHIDQNYRTLRDRINTGIMGSSLGGLISFYAALQYAETFGKAAVFSPSFEIVNKSDDFAKKHSDIQESKLYFMAGKNESEKMVARMQETIHLMISEGFPAKNIQSKVVNEGQHNEKLWREEFGAAVTWLFKK